MVHLEDDLVLTNAFTTPVTITAIAVLTPDGQSLHRLASDVLEAVTRPLVGGTPSEVVPHLNGLLPSKGSLTLGSGGSSMYSIGTRANTVWAA
jgi:hypothetical protein